MPCCIATRARPVCHRHPVLHRPQLREEAQPQEWTPGSVFVAGDVGTVAAWDQLL